MKDEPPRPCRTSFNVSEICYVSPDVKPQRQPCWSSMGYVRSTWVSLLTGPFLVRSDHTCIQNAFWILQHSDPYRGISFDIIHVIDGGLVKHILKAIMKRLFTEGKEGDFRQTKVDDRYAYRILYRLVTDSIGRFSLLPVWNGHTQIEHVTSMTFADHKKWLSVFLVRALSFRSKLTSHCL